jgi:hypothetical protein
MGTCFCFLQQGQFRILPCTADHISFTDGGEATNYNLTCHKNYVFEKKCIKSFDMYSHHLAL